MLKKNIQNFIISANIAQRSSRILPVNINMNVNTVCQTMFVKTARRDFSFKKDLQVHSCVHSGQGKSPCTNCPNKYNSRASMDAHHIVHQNQKFTCEKCPTFSTNTLPNLHQHQRNKHGQGWRSPCGKQFDWPPKMFRQKKVQ